MCEFNQNSKHSINTVLLLLANIYWMFSVPSIALGSEVIKQIRDRGRPRGEEWGKHLPTPKCGELG